MGTIKFDSHQTITPDRSYLFFTVMELPDTLSASDLKTE